MSKKRTCPPPSSSDSGSESDSSASGQSDPAAHKISRSSPSPQQPLIQCTLPPRCTYSPQAFASYAAFETHYATSHTLVCTSCARSFPSQHLLDLHLAELHDPFVAARRDRGDKVYRCFVEGCDKVCADTRKRRLHLIDKHGFPREFMFGIVAHGLRRNQASLLYPPRKPRNVVDVDDDDEPIDTGEEMFRNADPSVDCDGEPYIDEAVAAVEREFRGIKLVPDKIRFGRKRGN
ncbi:hypothetical protein V1517DRAFT_332049 [Lipomyces orientalis]|uniref:Uncharacterized protein n=1 Tax=Lipomyces orientalis TaxID=1233043 RepID=A0ACC3THJ7_9ASCO